MTESEIEPCKLTKGSILLNTVNYIKNRCLALEALPLMYQFVVFTGAEPSVTVPVSSCCGIYAIDHKKFLIYVSFEKNLSWVPFNVSHGKFIRFALLFKMKMWCKIQDPDYYITNLYINI